MTLPVVIPNEFANATASIPLSQLDSNFSTLANVVNQINAGTQQLSNANVVTLIVTGNATIGDASSDTVTLNSTLTANTAVIFSAGTSAAPAITTTGDTNTGIFFPAADTIAFAEGGAEAMRIDSSGNVGIGVTPSAWGGALGSGVFQNRSYFSIAPYSNLPLNYLLNNAYYDGTNFKYLSDYAASQIVLNQNGEFSFLDAPSGTTGNNITFTERLKITNTNIVFAGSIDAKVTVSGQRCFEAWNQATSGDNVFITFYTEGGAGTFRGSIDYNRGAGLVRYNTTSDATLKNIIGDSDGAKSVEILNSTRIREFAWKDDETQKPQIGVIAQELYETYKGAVSVGGDVEKERDITEEVEEEYTDEEGNTQTRTVTRVTGQETYTEYRPWAVDKTAFTFHLVAGWQAHEKIIKQQAEMIAALEARIAALENA